MTEALQPCGSAQFRTRYQDGWEPVEVRPDGTFQVGGQCYPSARQLLIAVTGHPQARHWTFDRYFRTGRHALSSTPVEVTTLDLFVVSPSFDPVLVQPDPQCISTPTGNPLFVPDATNSSHSDPLIVGIHTPGPLSLPNSGGLTVEISPVLGIDLRKRGGEVAKLFFAGFGKQVLASGYDPADVLQEVYKGILVRNQGRCPFDARKASFGHYVHMVCQCVVSNYYRRQSRVSRWEEIEANREGVIEAQDDPWDDLQRQIRGNHRQAEVARLLVPLVRQGMDRTEMASQLGVGKAVISRALRFLRTQVRQFAH